MGGCRIVGTMAELTENNQRISTFVHRVMHKMILVIHIMCITLVI